MSLAILFHFYVLNMFRTLIYPSSEACDCAVELPHPLFCSRFVVCWRFGAFGFEWCLCCWHQPATQTPLKQSKNFISIVKPTRCTSLSNLFYFGTVLYMFRKVFPSIANREQYRVDRWLLLYVKSWTPGDGRKDRPKHVKCHSKIKQIWYVCTSSWFCYRNNITTHGPVNFNRKN